MASDQDWTSRPERSSFLGYPALNAIHVALIFGSAAVALALVLAPIAENYAAPQILRSQLDYTATGSTGSRAGYTIRRSVLQDSATAVCIIQADGRRSGSC